MHKRSFAFESDGRRRFQVGANGRPTLCGVQCFVCLATIDLLLLEIAGGAKSLKNEGMKRT